MEGVQLLTKYKPINQTNKQTAMWCVKEPKQNKTKKHVYFLMIYTHSDDYFHFNY